MIQELDLDDSNLNDDSIDRLFKGQEIENKGELSPNNYYILKNGNTRAKVLIKATKKIIKAIPYNLEAFGIKCKNNDFNQLAYLDSILDSQIELILAQGKAGSGKTAIALAGALELLVEKEKYSQLIIFKSSQTDKIEEIGFLPGNVDEKLKQSFFQIERFLIKYLRKEIYEKMRKQEIIMFQPMSQILGWDLEDAIVILDEAQILDKDKIHQVLTRVGKDSKLIITGDPKQQINKSLYKQSGLEYLCNEWDEEWVAKITLEKTYRSKIAAKASEYTPEDFFNNVDEYRPKY